MSKVVGILQPGYLPWLGFFDQLARVDLFVLYDDVQFEKGSWRNRNRIKTAQGLQWLCVPVLTKGKDFPLVKDIRINPNEFWNTKHVKALTQNYAKAKYFEAYAPGLFALLEQNWERLQDLNLAIITWLAAQLGITTEMVLSSRLGIPGASTDRLIRILQHLGGDVFYEGAAGKNYIQPAEFSKNGIKLVFQEYAHPVYDQLYGDFASHLSVVDLLFNCGTKSLDIILSGGAASTPAMF
jgi:hypothetical protein